MRLLIDTNIILDIALYREPFYKYSANLFKRIDNITIFGFVTANTSVIPKAVLRFLA